MPQIAQEAQISHLLEQVRETVKHLESRALLLALPVVLTTFAITNSAIPHFQRVDKMLVRLKDQEGVAAELKKQEFNSLREGGYTPNTKQANRRKLTAEQRQRVEEREASTFELKKTRQETLKSIKRATVEVPIPGSEKIQVSLFYACAALQGMILIFLFHLWALRNRALQYLSAVSEKCHPLSLSNNRELAGPVSSLLLPIPQDEGIVTLLGARSAKVSQRVHLYLLLLTFLFASFWLLRLNSRISDVVELRAAFDHLPFVIGAVLFGATLCLVLFWLLLPPTATTFRPYGRIGRRLFLIAMLGSLATAALATYKKPLIKLSVVRKFRELTHKILWPAPRYRSKTKALHTNLVKNGFLFNPNSKRFHLVVDNKVASVNSSPRQETAFARFIPIDSLSVEVGSRLLNPHSRRQGTLKRPTTANSMQIANGLTTVAIERAVFEMLHKDHSKALDFLRDSIVSRLPSKPPERSASLDLRLFDLYAKQCVVHFEDDRLKGFVQILKKSNLGFLVADRIDRWRDQNSKWRKRVLNYGRCSNVGYPVVGRCGFESRSTIPNRSRNQWFYPESLND